ncbi:hypothetical protein HHI36_023275 [Cryptolaemus montrouzieri]|uniref:Homeobox domain-containing protein n=1 Tax=Cryptolaemus montrouzieri TaxID=559131 RepID=A0ABD2PGN5_9CUCU
MFSEEQEGAKLSPKDDFPQPFSQEDFQVHSPQKGSDSVSAEYESSDNKEDVNNKKTLTWHEHVYRRLTSKPTPHYIENILGIQCEKSSETDEHELKNMCLAENSDSFAKDQSSLTDAINEPLNLSIRNNAKVKTKTGRESSRKRKKGIEPLDLKLSSLGALPVDSVAEDADAKSKKKKARTTFTGRQIFELEKQFESKKYLSSSERSEMAKLLNVTETQVSYLK